MKRIHILSAMLCTLLFSCSKKDPNVSTPTPTPTTPSYSSMDEVFNTLSVKPKTVTLDAASGGSFFGNSGTRYILYGNSLMTASGANVIGNVDIQVSEYLDKGDMLFSKMLPISNGDALISGGEVNIVATQGGQEVFLKPHSTAWINIPTKGTPPTGMQLFTGHVQPDSAVAKVNWVLPVRDSTKYMVGVFTYPGKDTLQIISDSLKYCNADQFMTLPNYQNFTVSVTVTGATLPSSANVFAYTLYDNFKGVWPMHLYSTTDKKFTEGHVPNIPVHFAVFTLIDNKFYGGTLGVTPATGSNYTVNLTAQDAAKFKASLNNL